MPRRLCWATVTVMGLACRGLTAAAGTEIDIRPGLKAISAEEAALAPDPARGLDRGVILLDETLLDDAYGNATKIAFHRRAKIFSNEGRDLANVEIRLEPDMTLEDWWARTLLPDGRILNVADKDVAFVTLLRQGSSKLRVARIALQGIVPGSVVDYGYRITRADFLLSHQVSLERPWPTLKFRYRWKTWSRRPSAYRLRNSEKLDVQVETDDTSVLITGNNLTTVTREAFMPPDGDIRPAAVLYYMHPGDRYDDFWNASAKRIEKQVAPPANVAVVRRVVVAAQQTGTADLIGRLRAAYDWIADNVRNPRFARPGDGARVQLVPAEGPLDPINKLYLDVARALGAQAHVLLTPNRDDGSWDPSIRSLDQLPTAMVAVRAPSATDDEALFVHPSAGLSFAEVPWWNSGVQAMLATAQGARPILVTPSRVASNVSRVSGELSFSSDGNTLQSRWRRNSIGQNGMSESHSLGGLSDNDRHERIVLLCTDAPETDVTRADQAPSYPPLSSRTDCQATRSIVTPDATADRHNVAWNGPWVGPVPSLPQTPRIHSVVFDYPRVDTLELLVKPPPGFRVARAPEPVELAGPYGRYKLTISSTAEGYKVQRAFALLAESVPAAEYEALRSFVERVVGADRTSLRFERTPATGAD